MTKIIDFFLARPIVVNLFSVMVVVIGIYSMINLRKETFPKVDFDVITIRVNYPGSSTEDTEKLIGIELERALKVVTGIKNLNVLSGEGYSIANLEVDVGYHIDEVLDEVRNAVDTIDDFPAEAEKPVIKKINNKERGLFAVAVSGDDEWKLRELSKKLRDLIELDKGVARVELDGYRDEQIEIAVSPNILNKYELTLSDVANAVKDRNINLSAGTAETPESEIMVRTQSEYVTKKDVEEVVIRSNASGAHVKVSEIARVNNILKNTKEEQRVDKKKSIFLRVIAKEMADVVSTSDEIFAKIEKYFKDNKIEDATYTIVDDISFYVKRRLSVLTSNGIQGMILVFLALFAFLNLRISIITSLGAPIAFMVAFTVMGLMDLTVNLISMFGLIMVLGMLVDDSIIVAELFYQYVEEGMSPKEAARKAAIDTLGPVTATIITTMIAFGALFFMGGIMGKFLWPVPAAVIVCLAASWFECFFILPSHLADFIKPHDKTVEKTKWYQPVLKKYREILNFCLTNYKKTILAFGVLLIASIILYVKQMRFELFPGDDVTVLFVSMKAPVGTPIEVTNSALRIAEEVSFSQLKKDELMNLRSVLGQAINNKGGSKKGSHYATVIYYITMSDERKRTTDEIMTPIVAELKEKIKTHDVSFDRFQNGPPKGKPINIELSGDSLEELKEVSHILNEKIAKVDGVTSTEIDFEEGKKQIIVSIDEDEARRLGLSNSQIAIEIRAAYEGLVATEIRRNDEDVEVIVHYNEEARSSIETLNSIFVNNNMGQRIKLTQVAKFSEAPGAFVIRRYQRKRTISVSGEIDIRKLTVNMTNKIITPIIESVLKDHPTINYELSGEAKDTEESMGGLKKAAMLALFGIFLILVLNFGSLAQPLIVMSAIPLGLIGVIVTFFVMGLPLSFMAFMGIVGLVGVVVNDSIVLVSFINDNVKKNSNYFEAIRDGAISRFRAVILTTATTAAGLLPIAHANTGDPFLKPMAISFAYGLIFSTSLTLIFVPCSYYAYKKILDWWAMKRPQKN